MQQAACRARWSAKLRSQGPRFPEGEIAPHRSDPAHPSSKDNRWSIIRAAFILDTHDREAIAWRAVAGAGISGSDDRLNHWMTGYHTDHLEMRRQTSNLTNAPALADPQRTPNKLTGRGAARSLSKILI